MFVDQLRLRPENDFGERLWLVHGDQLTTHHIRTVKAEQMRAQLPFDRRDWVLGIPAWFHIQMNLLNTIVRTHWASDNVRDEAHHCLSADIAKWGRSCSSRDSAKYYQIEPITKQGFTARVVALFYSAMRTRGYLTGHDDDFFTHPQKIETIIASLKPPEFLQLVEDVRLAAFTLDAWNGKHHTDTEFTTMCRMLQEIELFLTVGHAVKNGDIGMLRRLVDSLIIYFFGASQHNYGREMLYYRWLLSSANTPELQHAILASGIVNWHGRATTHKPIDLGLEHMNGAIAISLRSFKNSTHDTHIVFNRMCLANTWIGALREKLEQAFGEEMSGAHSTVDVASDIFLLARTIFLGDLAEPRSTERLASFPSLFESADILQIGMGVLADRVDAFNKQHVRRSGVFLTAYPSLDPGFDDGFIDIHDSVEHVEEDEAIIEMVDLSIEL
jgi:hypothetical protein